MSNNSALGKTWSTDDLRNAASNWNLTGDKALLDLLKNMHENLQVRANDLICKLDTLNTEIGNTSLSLKNVNNRFFGLNNTQFVERSVQEDEPEIIRKEIDRDNKLTINTHVNTRNDKDDSDVEKKEKVANCVAKSLRELEGLCERLEISPDSDSDSDSQPEDVIQRTVLRLIDMYSENPLPYLIGSSEWKKKWHIGLHECSSESESEDDIDNKIIPGQRKDSDSSFEEMLNDDLRSEEASLSKLQMPLPVPILSHTKMSPTSMLTNDSTDTEDSEVAKINANVTSGAQSNIERKDGHEEQGPIPKMNASDFAAELARKLGGGKIIPNPINEDVSQDRLSKKSLPKNKPEERKGIIKQGDARKGMLHTGYKSQTAGNIFFDEPPPLDNGSNDEDDEKDDLFGSNDSLDVGLFSSKPIETRTKSSNLFGDISSSKHGLFSNNPDDDDNVDEYIVKSNSSIKTEIKPNEKNSLFTKNFYDDDSDEDIFSSKVNKNSNKEENKHVESNAPQRKGDFNTNKHISNDILDSSVGKKTEIKSKIEQTKAVSVGLFDDSDDGSDLFSGSLSFTSKSISSKGTKPSNNKSTLGETSSKRISLFDDTSDDDRDLFSSLKPSTKPISPKLKSPVKTAVQTNDPKPRPAEIVEERDPDKTEDLFASLRMPAKKSTVQSTSSQANKINKPIDEKQSDKNDLLPTKKPSGAVSMFGDNVNILKGPNSITTSISSRRRQSSSDESVGNENVEPIKEIAKTNENLDSLENTKPDSKSSQPKSQHVVDPDHMEADVSSVEHSNIIPKLEPSSSSPSLTPHNKDVSESAPPHSKYEKAINKNNGNLFGDDNDNELFPKLPTKSENIFNDPDLLDIPPPMENTSAKKSEPKNANSLFDDDDEDDDLFFNTKVNKGMLGDTLNYHNSNMFYATPSDDRSRNNYDEPGNLFSDEPPDLDFNPNKSVYQYDFEEPIGKYVTSENIAKEFGYNNDNKLSLTSSKDIVDNKVKKDKKSLFDGSSDEDEDLFSSLLKKKSENVDKKLPELKNYGSALNNVNKPVASKVEVHTKIDNILDSQNKSSTVKDNSVHIDFVEAESLKKSVIDVQKSKIVDKTRKVISPTPLSEEYPSYSKVDVGVEQIIKNFDSVNEKNSSQKLVNRESEEEETDGNSSSSLLSSKESHSKTSPSKAIEKLKSNLNINVKALMPASFIKKNVNIKEPLVVKSEQSKEEPASFDTEPKSLDSVLVNSWSKDKIKIQVKRRPQSRKARQEAARKSVAETLYGYGSTDNGQYVHSLPTSPIEVNADGYFSNNKPRFTDFPIKSETNSTNNTIQTIGSIYAKSEEINYETTANFDEQSLKSSVESEDLMVNKMKYPPENSNDSQEDQKNIGGLKLFVANEVTSKTETRSSDKQSDFTQRPDKEKSLFTDDDSSDDMLFKTSNQTTQGPKDGLSSQHGAIKKDKMKTGKKISYESDSDSDLFSSKPKKTVNKPRLINENKPSLFGDSDTEDDLFTNIPKKTLDLKKQNATKSLFGDSDEDVDIFKTVEGSIQHKSSDTKRATTTISKQTASIKQKTTSEVTTIDPLSSFLDGP